MKIKAALLDFDGTITNYDCLTLACEFAGKKQESEKLNEEFMKNPVIGLDPLITRINFLKGQDINEINAYLNKKDHLMSGAEELIKFLKKNNIISIVTSGNIISILKFYQEKLGFDYIFGSNPKMDGDKIIGIDESDYPSDIFKISEPAILLQSMNILKDEVISIGDSPADRSIFDFSAKSIAINPRDGIEKYADYVIKDDLREAIKIISELND